MRTFSIALAALAATVAMGGAASAQDFDTSDSGYSAVAGRGSGADSRLMIVDGNRRRVIYDDGRNDLYCVTRRVTVGYDDYGRPVRRRTMNCR